MSVFHSLLPLFSSPPALSLSLLFSAPNCSVLPSSLLLIRHEPTILSISLSQPDKLTFHSLNSPPSFLPSFFFSSSSSPSSMSSNKCGKCGTTVYQQEQQVRERQKEQAGEERREKKQSEAEKGTTTYEHERMRGERGMEWNERKGNGGRMRNREEKTNSIRIGQLDSFIFSCISLSPVLCSRLIMVDTGMILASRYTHIQ